MNAMNASTSQEPLNLGRALITSSAKETLYPHEVLSALWSHAREGWGKTFGPDDAENASPAKEDRRLVSNHRSSCGIAFRIATETLLPVTTVFLADECDLSAAGLVEDWVCNIGCPNCGG